MYYWILVSEEGKNFKDGPFNTEDEAKAVCIQRGSQEYRVFPLNTRDAQKAGQEIRHILWREGKPVGEIFSRQYRLKQQPY